MMTGKSRGARRLVRLIPTPCIYDGFSIFQGEWKRGEGKLDRAGSIPYHAILKRRTTWWPASNLTPEERDREV